MPNRLPPSAILLGLAGLIPFVACAFGALGAQPVLARESLDALLAYGAVILAFLGGVHWGCLLQPPAAIADAPARTRTGLVVGVLPSLIGWTALLTPLVAPVVFALPVLVAGFLFAAAADTQAVRAGLMPGFYLWLRWPLTVVVITVLTTTLVLRLLGVVITY